MTEITLKKGSGKPADTALVEAEFALDVATGKIYSKLSDGKVRALNDAEFIGIDANADNYQYWQYKINGFNTTSVMSTSVLDFQSGDGIQIDKEGYGIKISATGGSAGGSLWEQNGDDIYYADGNVGIGTDSPLFQAIDRTAVTINGTASSNLVFGVGGSANTYLLADSSGFTIGNTSATLPTQFYTNGSERMRIGADGNVGIRSQNPSGQLEVSTGVGTAFFTRSAGDDGTTSSAIAISTQATETSIGSTNDLTFNVGPAGTSADSQPERVRISSDGNVIVEDRISLVRLSGDLHLPIARYWDGTGKPLTGTTNKGDQLAIGAAGGLGLDLITRDVARVKIDDDGKMGIGGEPGTRTAADYIDQAKVKIKSWTAAIKTKLDEEPKANKKAVTLEVTDDAFEVIPTEDLVAEWMAERAIGGGTAKLQVAGDVYASGLFKSGTGVLDLATSTGYLRVQGTNRVQFDQVTMYPTYTGTMNLGMDSYRWNNAYFSGTVNADTVTANRVGSSISGRAGFQFAGSSIILPIDHTAAITNGAADLGRPSNRFKDAHFSGTIYGNVDDVPSHVKAITPTQIANWDAGTGGGGGGATTDGRISDTQITNWDQAHGWGNHATAGYQPAGSYAAANHNHSGVYQPAGNYALVGASYTKAESDGKYELKGAGGLPAGDWACTGSITAAGNITAYSSSDERLKDDIEAMPVGLIDDIKPSTWNWKEGGKASGGVVAQQLQSCGLGQWVNEAPNGDLGVDYNALIGVLLAEVQSLKARVVELEDAD